MYACITRHNLRLALHCKQNELRMKHTEERPYLDQKTAPFPGLTFPRSRRRPYFFPSHLDIHKSKSLITGRDTVSFRKFILLPFNSAWRITNGTECLVGRIHLLARAKSVWQGGLKMCVEQGCLRTFAWTGLYFHVLIRYLFSDALKDLYSWSHSHSHVVLHAASLFLKRILSSILP